jgi:hypothetical protein
VAYRGRKMAGDSGGQVVVHALYRHTHKGAKRLSGHRGMGVGGVHRGGLQWRVASGNTGACGRYGSRD